MKRRRRCDSSWWLRYIAGLEESAKHIGAWVGDWLHFLAEITLRDEVDPSAIVAMLFEADDEAGVDGVEDVIGLAEVKGADKLVDFVRKVEPRDWRIYVERARDALVSGLHRLPRRIDAEWIERPVELFTADPVPSKGFIDFVEPPFFDTKRGKVVLRVNDHKSSSNVGRWALSEEELRFDPQAVTYCGSALQFVEQGLFDEAFESLGFWRNPFVEVPSLMIRMADGSVTVGAPDLLEIRFRLIYYQTRGASKCVEIEVGFSPSEIVERLVSLLESDLDDMRRLSRERDLRKVPFNLKACGDYGGCAFRAQCARVGRSTMDFAGLFAGKNRKPEDRAVSRLKELMAKRRAETAGSAEEPETKTEEAEAPAKSGKKSKLSDMLAKRKAEADEGHGRDINPSDGTPDGEVGDEDDGSGGVAGGAIVFPEWVDDLAGKKPKDLSKVVLRETGIPALREALASVDLDPGEDPFEGVAKSKVGKDDYVEEAVRLIRLCLEADDDDESAEDAPEGAATETDEAPEAESPPESDEAESGGENRCIGLLVIGGTAEGPGLPSVAYLDEWISRFEAEVAEASEVAHVNMLSHAEGEKKVAAVLDVGIADGEIEPPPVLVARFPSVHSRALSVLVKYAEVVIRY